MERLQSGECGIEGGIALVDLVTSFERISSHCANISLHIVKRVGNDRDFDEMHGHANDSFSEEYKALYHYYESQYITPIMDNNQTALVKETKDTKDTKDSKDTKHPKKEGSKKDTAKHAKEDKRKKK